MFDQLSGDMRDMNVGVLSWDMRDYQFLNLSHKNKLLKMYKMATCNTPWRY